MLRWYPRAWRERYGKEFLAMVEDSLDGRRPTWRLRVSVAWAGLRERGHQTRLTSQKALLRSLTRGWLTFQVAGYLIAVLPSEFKASPPPARQWQATAALGVLTAIAAFTGVALLAGSVAAAPAFVRYLQAGGWPKVRRRIAWAAGATVAAGGALAGLVLASLSESFSQLNGSPTYLAGVLATSLALVVALWLWTSVITTAAKRLDLAPRVRKAEKILGMVATFAVSVVISVNVIWYSAIQSSVFQLLLGLTALAATALAAATKIRLAARSGRRLRSASGRGR